MPRHTEPSANNDLRGLLQEVMPGCEVRSENTQVIVGRPSLRPDILVAAPDRSPVAIEAEYMPALTAEEEARGRMGLNVTVHPHPIEAAIALRYPEDVGDSDDLQAALNDARLSYCVFTVEKYRQTPSREIQSIVRFPESGWLEGSYVDLADLVRLVSVPQKEVDQAADTLQSGIEIAASVLNQMTETRPDISPSIASRLNMTDAPQMRRMACAIIANAMLFHERLAGRHSVKSLQQICGFGARNPQADLLEAWYSILAFNYLDIFDIAKAIVEELPTREGSQILNIISQQVLQIASSGVNNDHDLTGQVFQRLIADRKYLATFYTLPASAALLARLAVAKMEGMDWSDVDMIGRLRIADFACGTGTLLAAVYEQIAARHERASGELDKLHPVMMEDTLYGCDVMPSAIHITGSTLAGLRPNVEFRKSNLLTMPYGRQSEDSVAIGSLELLDANSEHSKAMPENSFDLVIMNPPFTRAGSDWEGSDRTEDYIKQFRGLGTELETQEQMSKRLKDYSKGSCYHGYAGIASAFAALADKKLKPGGVLALVLPLSAASGISWREFRHMLTSSYTDLTVVSIAASDNDDLSFSADTGLGECLVIAKKLDANQDPSVRIHFVSLRQRPEGFAHSNSIARTITGNNYTRRIEDGPYGGTPLIVGDELMGEMLAAPAYKDGGDWSEVRLADYSLAQTAYELAHSRLWLPGSATAFGLQVVPLNQVGKRGYYHMNIAGNVRSGPFTKGPPSQTATYPCLWNHNAQQETRLVCVPDSELRVRQGMEAKAAEVWATASRSHINQDFRFNSQPLCAAFTDRESIGGTAWPNVHFDVPQFDYALSLWANSTLGLLCFWWHASRQTSGRGRITISQAETLPVLDFRALSDEQLALAQEIFEEFRDKELKPAYLADADPNRALLDRRVVCDLLGFNESVYEGIRRLAAKWCAEPSVHGGKARPKDAVFVI